MICSKYFVFLRQDFMVFTMQSVEDKVLNNIKKCGRGKVYFTSDFASYGQPKAVSKALERLLASGDMVRLARGIYLYPKVDKELGLGVLYPNFEELAQSIAKRDHARLVPAGNYALNRLGLSTQIPMNVVYLTDGSQRKITIGHGRGITFKHAAPKTFAFTNELAMLIVVGLKEIGEKNITPEQIARVQELVKASNTNTMKQDLKLMPAWIRSIVMNAYE